MLEPYTLATVVASLAKEILIKTLKDLGQKYSVDIQDVEYILNQEVQEEFQKCLDVAIKAFIGNFAKDLDIVLR
jgi:predicted transcriptional regulator